MLGQIDRSVERPLWTENLGGMEFSETRFAVVVEIKDTPSSGVDAKVKRGVKQELALPSKKELVGKTFSIAKRHQ